MANQFCFNSSIFLFCLQLVLFGNNWLLGLDCNMAFPLFLPSIPSLALKLKTHLTFYFSSSDEGSPKCRLCFCPICKNKAEICTKWVEKINAGSIEKMKDEMAMGNKMAQTQADICVYLLHREHNKCCLNAVETCNKAIRKRNWKNNKLLASYLQNADKGNVVDTNFQRHLIRYQLKGCSMKWNLMRVCAIY